MVLAAVDLEKTFYSTHPPTRVLSGIDLEVTAGEFLAVMGASGSGKSTLPYCLRGMDRPTGGSVWLEGRDLTGLADREMSQVRLTEMGFIFQQAYFVESECAGQHHAARFEGDAQGPRRGLHTGGRAAGAIRDLPRRRSRGSPRCRAGSCSGRPSVVRWRPSRRSCSLTNRQVR